MIEVGDVYRQNEDDREVTVEKVTDPYVYVRNNVTKRQTEILRRFFGAKSKKGWTKVGSAAKVADVSGVDVSGLGTGDAVKPDDPYTAHAKELRQKALERREGGTFVDGMRE